MTTTTPGGGVIARRYRTRSVPPPGMPEVGDHDVDRFARHDLAQVVAVGDLGDEVDVGVLPQRVPGRREHPRVVVRDDDPDRAGVGGVAGTGPSSAVTLRGGRSGRTGGPWCEGTRTNRREVRHAGRGSTTVGPSPVPLGCVVVDRWWG